MQLHRTGMCNTVGRKRRRFLGRRKSGGGDNPVTARRRNRRRKARGRRRPYVRDDYGYNSHTVQDILLVTATLDDKPLSRDGRPVLLDYGVAEASSISVQGENGVEVWLERDERITQNTIRTVFAIDHVKANTRGRDRQVRQSFGKARGHEGATDIGLLVRRGLVGRRAPVVKQQGDHGRRHHSGHMG